VKFIPNIFKIKKKLKKALVIKIKKIN
jgi:hypothetical protein